MTAASGDKPNILARDHAGTEFRLGVVDHPAGLVTLYDTEMVRVLAPDAAIELAVALIHATRGYYPAAGPISATF